ncbi:hypothetical protein ENSA5_05150 [Enhygromyxa salina]|uniref:Uncharacterized protein n=1 Tax=Enhygromyxa salina TaxID=215803 RepID=A0A2S9YI47_9BACT|nr:hypothetical protein [Enhygromyxa salina]PRQ04750.1 hypothetical protein ENSA5_05150 [Enhygromyxa salina]
MTTNPIAESTEAFLASLSPEQLERAEQDMLRDSVRAEGVAMSLADEINLGKAILCIAGADGLSREELTGLKYLMIISGVPPLVQAHVQAFDASTTHTADVAALFPPASRKACYVLSGTVTVAALDGLSGEERDFAVDLGASLGLPPTLVVLLIAEARATALAMKEGNQAMVAELVRMREALYDFALEAPVDGAISD